MTHNKDLAEQILAQVEMCCGPLSTKAVVTANDDERSILLGNILSILDAPKTPPQETPMPSLNELIEKIEAAGGEPSAERALLSADIAIFAGAVPEDYEQASMHGQKYPFFWHRSDNKKPHWSRDYAGSIDAAMTLVPDGHYVQLYKWANGSATADVRGHGRIKGATPALALCAAALKARQEDNDNAG